MTSGGLTNSLPGASIAVSTLPNLRDLGGWPTPDGCVRRGLLYRSTNLSKLSDADMPAVAALGLRTVYDMRTESERSAEPDRLPDGVDGIVVDVLADATGAAPAQVVTALSDPDAAAAMFGGDKAVVLFEHAYRDIVSLPSALTAYNRFFSDLTLEQFRPALFHCTTGKDRTGWAAAAMLLLLGVSEQDVMREYLLTNDQLLPALQPILDQFAANGGDPQLLHPVLGVQPEYLNATLDEMRNRYGTIQGYFSAGLGFGTDAQAALRKTFTDPSPDS
jgi:protein-tyrosine phosphatase